MKRAPLDAAELRDFQRLREQGASLAEIAERLECSRHCARKQWRRLRDLERKEANNRAGEKTVVKLLPGRMGRPTSGPLGSFKTEVVAAIRRNKQLHPRWGCDRHLAELVREQRKNPAWSAYRLPKRSQVSQYLRLHFPKEASVALKRPAPPGAPPPATLTHEVWQMDMKEDVRLHDNSMVSICSMRDVFSGAVLVSTPFLTCEPADKPYASTKRGHKLSIAQLWSVFESGARGWATLPEVVQTDNEGQFVGSSTSDFPSVFTLHLVGHGVTHRSIRSGIPTDNGCIERTHRTLYGFVFGEEDMATIDTLRQALQREVETYNTCFNSRSKHCCTESGQGQPPLIAHPELLDKPRPFTPPAGVAPFQIERVHVFVASQSFERKTTAQGQLTLGGMIYTVGVKHAKRSINARLDSDTLEWVFSLKNGDDANLEVTRRPDKNLLPENIQSLFQPRSMHNPPNASPHSGGTTLPDV